MEWGSGPRMGVRWEMFEMRSNERCACWKRAERKKKACQAGGRVMGQTTSDDKVKRWERPHECGDGGQSNQSGRGESTLCIYCTSTVHSDVSHFHTFILADGRWLLVCFCSSINTTQTHKQAKHTKSQRLHNGLFFRLIGHPPKKVDEGMPRPLFQAQIHSSAALWVDLKER